jgi:hypothetical protein
VIVHPTNRSQGMLVTKVYTKRDYYRVAKPNLQEECGPARSKILWRRDYRVVVLDDEVIFAIRWNNRVSYVLMVGAVAFAFWLR